MGCMGVSNRVSECVCVCDRGSEVFTLSIFECGSSIDPFTLIMFVHVFVLV